MEIIKCSSPDIIEDKVKLYTLIKGPGENVKNAIDMVLSVQDYIYFTETRQDTTREILSIVTSDGRVFRTVSKTFKDSFMDIVTDYVPRPVIRVVEGESKANRRFIDCILVDIAE